jgi:photosystem II stability/assembly factor-like uncharacterized protein
MKKIFLSICLMFLSVSAFAQWTLLYPAPTKCNLTSVYFADSNTGFAVGDSGTVLKTTDGGIIWSGLSTGTTDQLNSVYFTDPNTGYAAGDEGTILKTMDGGTTFTASTPKYTDWDLASVYFANATIGYAVGTGAFYILKTMNGGTTWTVLEIGVSDSRLYSVYFTDANTGYAVGGICGMRLPPKCSGIILSTNDGGLTWSFNEFDITSRLVSVYFTDANTGCAVGSKGAILKTINGGKTWSTLESGSTHNFQSVYFADASNGYIVGEAGTILKTMDAGITWNVLPSGTTNDLFSVYFTDANTGYSVGSGGTILKTTNGGGFVSINKLVSSETTFNLYPNPAIHKITISTNRTLTGETRISIISISGQQLMHTRFQNQKQFEMDVSTLCKGIYLVKLQSIKGIETKKLVIQ